MGRDPEAQPTALEEAIREQERRDRAWNCESNR